MNQDKRYVCQLDELEDPGSKGLRLEDKQFASHMLIKKSGQAYLYENHCPHTGAPLEWKPDQFLDHENAFIQCAMHGALFSIESGECLRGPCLGKYLHKVPLVVEDGALYVIQSELQAE